MSDLPRSTTNEVKLTWHLPDGPHVMQPNEVLVLDCTNGRIYVEPGTTNPHSS